MKKLLAFALLFTSATIYAQQPQSSPTTAVTATTPLERRANEVCAQFRAAPTDYDKLFTASFLAQVPTEQLNQIFAGYFAQMGRCTGVKLIKRDTANAGSFELTFEKGYTVPAQLAVEASVPYLLEGAFVGNPMRASASLTDIVTELKTFPGETSFLFAKLSNTQITPVVAHNADKPLAIGSAFKLYILSELTRGLKANERKLSDVVMLDPKAASLPSGIMHTWVAGSPVTLNTLATLMISISDNTATDQLLAHLGREKVESVQTITGHSKPELNMPFLSTLEMFKLKGEPTGKADEQYLALDPKARRQFLSTQIAAVKREDVKPFADGKPSHIDTIEWFASANDLARVMNYLRVQTENDPKTAQIREILSINPGLKIPRDKWRYAGYKGGSEPGVLTMTYLLQSTSGEWFVLSMEWNNKQAALEQGKFFALMQRALQIAQ